MLLPFLLILFLLSVFVYVTFFFLNDWTSNLFFYFMHHVRRVSLGIVALYPSAH